MSILPPAALAYARKHGLHALVVSHDGRIVDEAYGDGHDGATPHPLYSGAKSFWGVTALIARNDGLLDLDEHVADTFATWGLQPWKSKVTLRELLQLTSGIGFGGMGLAVPTYAKALDVELKNEPGTKFTYGGIPLQVFGAVLARKLESLGETPHEYLTRRILNPIGLEVGKWRTLADGTKPLPTGAFVAPLEWIKYGQFVCERHAEFAPCFKGSKANARYGLGWWLGVKNAPDDLFYASGAAGQAMYVVPSRKLVIVHFAKSSSYKHEAFLKQFFSKS
ncbi:MAG TPA: serine hydrolase domain-containing protein [Candidatus Eremiobacteraceae bacterium]|nr:serine hydrolase domain-containing protein [Candidatus Eremiobacteraceae bacterium]